jgi:ribosomal protein L17
MANERNIEAIDAGREATVIAGAIRGYVDDQIRQHLVSLMSMYRNVAVRPVDHDQILGKVAEITALSDLISDLENVARRGDTAARREFGDAKTS